MNLSKNAFLHDGRDPDVLARLAAPDVSAPADLQIVVDALEIADQTVRTARMAGTRKDLLRARILHATVLQFRGSLAAAAQELTTCAVEAEGAGWASIAAFAYQHRGKVHYDAGDFDAARADFKRALFARQSTSAPDDQLESTLLAIDAAERRRAEAGAAVAS